LLLKIAYLHVFHFLVINHSVDEEEVKTLSQQAQGLQGRESALLLLGLQHCHLVDQGLGQQVDVVV
jgi:hypothetical protein